ncbi:MAG TPA: hypothetical protein VF818_09295 [Ktedonobacterales bacterium]
MRDRSTHEASPAVAVRWLRPLAAGTLLVLALQFLVGMVVNLYVQIPASHPGTNAPEYFSGVAQGVVWALSDGAWSLKLHAVVGLLLFIAAIVMLVFAIMLRRRAWIIATVVGLLGIMSAGFNGASFMNYGHDFSSLIMSTGFLIAVIAYAVGFYVTR